MIPLSHYLMLAALLFGISVAGIFLNRKNVILLLMCIELMLLAVNINFVAFSAYLGDLVAASEAAIGLAILILVFRNRHTVDVEELDEMRG
jgi:NADH-quinone oxidoreductase subunit K